MIEQIPIYKIEATGNDFIAVDLRDSDTAQLFKSQIPIDQWANWSRSLCARQWRIGADGVVFLLTDKELDFCWDFYNADGSSAAMCGNAVRAVSLLVGRELGKSDILFRTRLGAIRAVLMADGQIQVELPPVVSDLEDFTSPVPFVLVNSGVPHAVCVGSTASTNWPQLAALAESIRGLPKFSHEGINVTFYSTLAANSISCVTYERGINGFTLSCGTGALAAAYAHLRGKHGQWLNVTVPGGQLRAKMTAKNCYLEGPAKIVAKIQLVHLS